MAIAIECFSIVVPKSVIAAKYPGGVTEYGKHGGPTFVEDEYLTAGGAMNWTDVEAVIQYLAHFGIQYLDKSGKSVEIVVVDMIKGPMTPCDWIEFESGEHGPRCWFRGTIAGKTCKPNRPTDQDGTIVAFRSLS